MSAMHIGPDENLVDREITVARISSGIEVYIPSGGSRISRARVCANGVYEHTMPLEIGVTQIERSSLLNSEGLPMPGDRAISDVVISPELGVPHSFSWTSITSLKDK